jgi:hypothetical protein
MRSTVSPRLRSALTRITDEQPLPSHARAVERLKVEQPHSIAIVEDGTLGPHGYNCFMYALRLRILPIELVRIATRVEEAYPSSAFVSSLIEVGLRTIADAEARAGDIAIYFDDASPQHAGICSEDGTITSKWGATGHLWHHPVFEVPAYYGDEVRFYTCPDEETVLQQFTRYVERVLGIG